MVLYITSRTPARLSNPNFTERTGTANPLDSVTVGSFSTPTFTDLDGDGDHDLIVGNEDGDIAYFEYTGTVTAPSFTQRTGTTNPFDNITKGSWSTVTLADLDGDGDLDLAVGNNDGDVHYYENTGTSANPSFTQRADAANPLNNINAGSYNSPIFVDFDDDNDPDLVIGNQTGIIFYFENTGTTTAPSFIQRTDFDNPFQRTPMRADLAHLSLSTSTATVILTSSLEIKLARYTILKTQGQTPALSFPQQASLPQPR